MEKVITMPLKITEQAARHVQQKLAERGHGLGLRIGTKKDGCNGFAYIVDYADDIHDDDKVFQQNGVSIIVSQKHMSLLGGTEIDFVSNNALSKGFEFHNPNVKDSCGCGESFSVE